MKIYLQPDVRLQASNWINNNLEAQSTIIYEGGNVVDLPQVDQIKFNTLSLDFYHLEDDKKQQAKLEKYLERADYYLMPSRRHFANYLRLENKYPYTNRFYKKLFNNYPLVKKFTPFGPVGQFLLGPDILTEETWTVFDHPTIRLFKIN